jgi:hypothetical protein
VCCSPYVYLYIAQVYTWARVLIQAAIKSDWPRACLKDTAGGAARLVAPCLAVVASATALTTRARLRLLKLLLLLLLLLPGCWHSQCCHKPIMPAQRLSDRLNAAC